MASDTFLRDWVLRGRKILKRLGVIYKKSKSDIIAFTAFFVSEKTMKYYHLDGVLKSSYYF
jgi:hypothetical protein